MNIIPIEKDWQLCALAYSEQSPLENHGFMELGADDENKRIYAKETMIRTYGLDSILAACRGYVNKKQ